MSADQTQDPWALYDALIAGIPDGVAVTDVVLNRWAAVATDQGTVGLGAAFDGGPPVDPSAWRVRGRPLREVAALARSWNLRLAGLGVAALNAWYAAPDRVAALPGVRFGHDADYFGRWGSVLGTRPTAVIGHFPDVEGLSGDITVLERRTRGDDLPDSACEYVLPRCELVAITGSTVVNKTLPRLLELTRRAEVHLVGPTAPPVPGVYPAQVREIAGSVVTDAAECLEFVALGLRHLVGCPALQMFSLPLTGAATPGAGQRPDHRKETR